MQFWTPFVIMILVSSIWLTWTIYGRQLLNKAVWAKSINPSILQFKGDIKIGQDTMLVKFWSSIKTLEFGQITQIKAYSQTDWGLEEYEQVDILFDNGNKIYFSGSLKEHREIIQAIVNSVSLQNQTWTWGFLPHLGDQLHRDVVFER